MDAFFVIPAMVSPNVNSRIIPALTKTIERNLLITYYANIRQALLYKYGGSNVYKEAGELIQEGKKTTPSILSKVAKSGTGTGPPIPTLPDMTTTSSKENEIGKWKLGTSAKDAIEYPRGITFYHTIGLEPTYLQIPMTLRSGWLGGESDRMFMVGVKCVPYQMEGVENIMGLIGDMKGRSMISKWFHKKWNSILTKIPLTIPRQIRKGARGGSAENIISSGKKKYDIKKDIMFAPTSDDLGNPKSLAKMMDVRSRSTWSTMTVFSNFDFDGLGSAELMKNYRNLSKAGWGDIIVVNEAKESAYYCTTKMQACFDMPFSYMRNIMNLDNILDYSEISRWSAKPFSVAPLKKALMDSYITVEDKNSTQLIQELNLIISGDEKDDTPEPTDIGADGGLGYPSRPITPGYSHFSGEQYRPNRSKPVRDLAGEDTGTFDDPFDGTEKEYFDGVNIIK